MSGQARLSQESVRSRSGHVKTCQTLSVRGDVTSGHVKSRPFRSGHVRSGQCNVRSGQAMQSNERARSGLVRFCRIMTSSGQDWSYQRRLRSRSAKDKSSLIISGQVQITSSLVRTWSGQVMSKPS